MIRKSIKHSYRSNVLIPIKYSIFEIYQNFGRRIETRVSTLHLIIRNRIQKKDDYYGKLSNEKQEAITANKH